MNVRHTVNMKDAREVEAFVVTVLEGMFPGAVWARLHRVFADVDGMFKGLNPEFHAIDVEYHDFEHTLRATACLALLLEGRNQAGDEPVLDAPECELALVSALLHDTGYLKSALDHEGTGGKFTYCHVLRSCAFAASYLPQIGIIEHEIETVLAAINCTGPASEMSRLNFRRSVDRIIGAALGTADYVSQMAAPDYPDDLPELFREFRESDEFSGVPKDRRVFQSAEGLIAATPEFWRGYVLPLLEKEHAGMYRFLSRPAPDGENDYLTAIEQNIAEIQNRIALAPACNGGERHT
ncbi:MAG: hypothetical protein V4773_18000 [Verrucomicrobiota bacterium]